MDNAIEFARLLRTQRERYAAWREAQVCHGCGAAFKDKAPDALWFTEQWCGCEAGRDLPDTRPDWDSFAE